MKKISFMLVFSIMTFLGFGLDVKIGKIYETIENNPMGTDILDLFYDENDELIIVFPRLSSRTDSVFN